MSQTLDLDHLEALACAATDHPWKHGSWPFRLTERDELELDGSPESALIAAANPAVILELVERLRRAEEVIAVWDADYVTGSVSLADAQSRCYDAMVDAMERYHATAAAPRR